MEALLGMILLLQVVISIQIMLAHRQVLQRLDGQGKSIERTKQLKACAVVNDTDEGMAEALQLPHQSAQDEQKGDLALINEVLSEVFH